MLFVFFRIIRQMILCRQPNGRRFSFKSGCALNWNECIVRHSSLEKAEVGFRSHRVFFSSNSVGRHDPIENIVSSGELRSEVKVRKSVFYHHFNYLRIGVYRFNYLRIGVYRDSFPRLAPVNGLDERSIGMCVESIVDCDEILDSCFRDSVHKWVP